MTEKELRKLWVKHTDGYVHKLDTAKALEAWSALGTAIGEALLAGEDVPLPVVGKLKVRTAKARNLINPATGEMMEVPERRKVALVMSKGMREALNP